MTYQINPKRPPDVPANPHPESKPAEWRPMNTAPRDGTKIEVKYTFSSGAFYTLHVWWDTDGSWHYPWRNEDGTHRDDKMTGWRALPPAVRGAEPVCQHKNVDCRNYPHQPCKCADCGIFLDDDSPALSGGAVRVERSAEAEVIAHQINAATGMCWSEGGLMENKAAEIVQRVIETTAAATRISQRSLEGSAQGWRAIGEANIVENPNEAEEVLVYCKFGAYEGVSVCRLWEGLPSICWKQKAPKECVWFFQPLPPPHVEKGA